MKRIFVKFSPGACGNFISTVLINLQTNQLRLEYSHPEILHLGPRDIRGLTYPYLPYRIINCNDDPDNRFTESFYREFCVIFVRVCDRFTEYRLNNIHKCSPEILAQSNQAAVTRWPNSPHPVAADEAERIRRLARGLEQTHVRSDPQDRAIYDFHHLYADRTEWIRAFQDLSDRVGQPLSEQTGDFWYQDFRLSQRPILDRAEQIRQSVQAGRFRPDLSENERGIVLGEFCVQERIWTYGDTLDRLYLEFQARS